MWLDWIVHYREQELDLGRICLPSPTHGMRSPQVLSQVYPWVFETSSWSLTVEEWVSCAKMSRLPPQQWFNRMLGPAVHRSTAQPSTQSSSPACPLHLWLSLRWCQLWPQVFRFVIWSLPLARGGCAVWLSFLEAVAALSCCRSRGATSHGIEFYDLDTLGWVIDQLLFSRVVNRSIVFESSAANRITYFSLHLSVMRPVCHIQKALSNVCLTACTSALAREGLYPIYPKQAIWRCFSLAGGSSASPSAYFMLFLVFFKLWNKSPFS